MKSTAEYDGFNIKNTYAPAKISVSVKKVWNDENDKEGKRPGSITIRLLANGKIVDGVTLVLNGGNGWSASFEDLYEYENGKKINYTIEEVKVDGYNTVISGSMAEGYTVTNNVILTEGPKTGRFDYLAYLFALSALAFVGMMFGGAVVAKKKN